MTRISVVALLLLGCSAQAQSDAKILDAIGQVESGMNRKARGDSGKAYGAYQMHRESWTQGNRQLEAEGLRTYALTSWRDATAQDMVALAYLRWLKARFRDEGYYHPTPAQIALAWSLGFEGASRLNFNSDHADEARRSHSERVANLSIR